MCQLHEPNKLPHDQKVSREVQHVHSTPIMNTKKTGTFTFKKLLLSVGDTLKLIVFLALVLLCGSSMFALLEHVIGHILTVITMITLTVVCCTAMTYSIRKGE